MVSFTFVIRFFSDYHLFRSSWYCMTAENLNKKETSPKGLRLWRHVLTKRKPGENIKIINWMISIERRMENTFKKSFNQLRTTRHRVAPISTIKANIHTFQYLVISKFRIKLHVPASKCIFYPQLFLTIWSDWSFARIYSSYRFPRSSVPF